jgi:hypothetical protein
VNIWALDKDQSIKHLLLLLQSHLGALEFIIEDCKGLHKNSVFLRHSSESDFRAYIFTIGQQPNRYGIHLEYPDFITEGSIIGVYENITLKSLVDMLAVHFDIAEIQHRTLL